MTTPTLSRMQHRILEFISDQAATCGYPPTVREIGAHVGLASTAGVHHQLVELELKGYLRRVHGRPRAIQVIWPDGVAA